MQYKLSHDLIILSLPSRYNSFHWSLAMDDTIPGTYNLAQVYCDLFSDAAATKAALKAISGGEVWDTLVDVKLNEVYPPGTLPYLEKLDRPATETDVGDMTTKFTTMATSMEALEDDERSMEVFGRLAERLLAQQSGAREYLAEKLVGEGKRMVVEGKKLGLEVLHIDIDVDITYQKVYLDNLP